MVLTFYPAGRKRFFSGIFGNSTISAFQQPEIGDAHSSDLAECSREPTADPSATSFLPCFQTAKPSPKKGPMSTAKKANKNSTRKRSTITMAGIGFPRSPSWNRVLLALGPTIDPTLGATKRGLTSLDVANNTAGYRKLLPLLTFFHRRDKPVSSSTARRSWQARAAILAWQSRKTGSKKSQHQAVSAAPQRPHNQFLPPP